MRNSTIAGHTPNAGHGGDEIVYSFGTLELQETLVAGGTAARGASCGGPVPPPLLGHNLDDDASCGPRGAGDLWGADLRLGPLQDNGVRRRPGRCLRGARRSTPGKLPAARRRPAGGWRARSGRVCDISAFEAAPPPPRPAARAHSPAGVGV